MQKLLSLLLCASSFLCAEFASVQHNSIAEIGVALPLDTLSQVYNPAHAVKIKCGLDIGLHAKVWKKSQPPDNAKTTHILCPEFGINCNPNCNWAVGLAIYSWEYNRVVFKDTGLEQAYWYYTASLAAAYRIFPCHCIGVALLGYTGRYMNHGVPGFVPTQSGFSHSYGIGWRVGYFGTLFSCLELGVAYSPKVAMHRYGTYVGFLPGGLPIPEKLSAGLTYFGLPGVRLCAEATHLWWSKAGSWSSGPPPAFRWRNQLILKFGAEVAFDTCYTVRLGYRYETLPFRRNTAEAVQNRLLIKTVQHYITTGFSVETFCGEISTYLEFGLTKRAQVIAAQNPRLKERTVAIGIAYGFGF